MGLRFIFSVGILGAVISLSGCTTPSSSIEPRNVPTTFYSHSISAIPVRVTLREVIPATKTKPTWYIYRMEEPVRYEGNQIIPKGSQLAAVVYYPNTPHIAIEYFRKAGRLSWTPAQGVISKESPSTGIATLSHLTIPR